MKPVAKEDITDSATEQSKVVADVDGPSSAVVADDKANVAKPAAPEKMEIQEEVNNDNAAAESTSNVTNVDDAVPIVDESVTAADKQPVEEVSEPEPEPAIVESAENEAVLNEPTPSAIVEEPSPAAPIVEEPQESQPPLAPIVDTPTAAIEIDDDSVDDPVAIVIADESPAQETAPIEISDEADEADDDLSIVENELIINEPEDVDIPDGIAPSEPIILEAEDAPRTVQCPIVEAPTADVVPLPAEALIAIEPPQEQPIVDDVQIAEAPPAIVQSEPVSAESQLQLQNDTPNNTNGDVANNGNTPNEQSPVPIVDNPTTKLDITTSEFSYFC